jgi:hypothetical protein
MDFSSTDLPYGLYGGKGGPSCWDTLPAHSCTASDGVTFSWTGHGLVNDQPVFVTGSQSTLWYVYAPTANTFQLSTNPYTAPGVVTPFTPAYGPHNFGGPVTLELNPYRYAVLGGNGGGVIGDQAIPGAPVGFYGEAPHPSSFYFYGNCGENQLGVGGRGGDGGLGCGGATVQVGGSPGNDGYNIQGGGGSGAGFMSGGWYPINQFGPGGGAGGTLGEIECELKPWYYFNAGAGGGAGAAGVGGYAGGHGGHGVVIVTEYF